MEPTKASLSTKKWNHDDLLFDLAEHLRKPERMMWCDMQLGPSGSPRPDIFTMAKSYSNPKPLVYEIKVSVADFRSDITSGKWQAYLKFACGVYFAVPAGMISKNDIPNGCGLIARGTDGWRTLRAPTMQHVTLPEEVMLKLLIDGVERHSRDRRIEYFDNQREMKIIKQRFGEDVVLAVSNLSEARAEAERITYSNQWHIDNARKKASEIVQFAERERDRVMQSINETNKELCEFLGVPINAMPHTLRAALHKLKQELSVNDRVECCERLLSRLERDLLHAREIFPAATAKTEQHSHS